MQQREERFSARREGIVRPEAVASDAVMRVLRVPPEQAGARLDRFVQNQLRATSRTRSQLIIDNSAFSAAGERLKKNHRVSGDERIVLWRPPWDEHAPDTKLPVIYEDGALLALNKPPHFAVHPTARHHGSTITVLLQTQRPEDRLTLLHRLDRETSGVLLLARTREADRLVGIQFERRRDVLKRYLAISWGWPSWERVTCELPLRSDPDSRYRVKMAVAPAGLGLESATTFELLERRRSVACEAAPERHYSMLRCTLHSGRQHQIRVHLAALGLPVVGDKLYGPDDTLFARGADGELTAEDLLRLELDRHALHASELALDQPIDGQRLHLEAPLWPDLQDFWDSLERCPLSSA